MDRETHSVVWSGPVDADDKFRMFVLDEQAQQDEVRGEDVIRLTLGKVDIPLHPDILTAMQRVLWDDSLNNLVFPVGLPELRNAISAHYHESMNITVPPSRIFIGAGSSSLFQDLFQLILYPGTQVLLPLPYYPLYRVTAQLAHGTVAYYPIDLDSLAVDLNTIAERINNSTRAIVINSPGNPLGNIVTHDQVCEIAALLPNTAYIILDAIYENTAFEETISLTQSLLNWGGFENVIVTNAFSKAYRMYARRVGWCILPEHLVGPMTTVLHHTCLTVDPIAQYGALAALKHPDDIRVVTDQHRQRWIRTRDLFCGLPEVVPIECHGGFYCTIDCRAFMRRNRIQSSLQLALDILAKVRVATVPGEDFGLPGMLRLSFTNKRYNEAISRLHEYFLHQQDSDAAYFRRHTT